MTSLAAILLCVSGAVSPGDAVAFRDVDVFDGVRVARRTTVLVRDGMIRAVGPDVVVPAGATVVEGRGRTLLPGLIDAHTHLGTTFGATFLEDALSFGVTTELEMAGSGASLDLRRQLVAGAPAKGADFRTAGTPITVPGGHPTQMGGPTMPTLGPHDDVQAFVDARLAEGGDYLKVIDEHRYPTLTREQLAEVAAAGHRRGRLVVAHVGTLQEARDAVAAGVDGLAHVFADAPPDAGFVDLAAQRGVFVVPTLSVLESATSPAGTTWWKDDDVVTARLTPSMRGSLARTMPPALGTGRALPHALEAVAALHRAGVAILAGTDAPAPGVAHGASIHRELELLVRSGLTPAEALAAATSATARAFGFHDRGRIAPGLRADLLLVEGDPTADVRATRRIVGVWKMGDSRRSIAVPFRRRTVLSSGMTIAIPSHLSDDELTAEVLRCARDERQATARLVAHLSEFDARRLYLAAACSSLFAYCCKVLGFSEHATYNRIEAARLGRRFPEVLDRLSDGRLNLSKAKLLVPLLTEANNGELLDAAARRSKRELEESNPRA